MDAGTPETAKALRQNLVFRGHDRRDGGAQGQHEQYGPQGMEAQLDARLVGIGMEGAQQAEIDHQGCGGPGGEAQRLTADIGHDRTEGAQRIMDFAMADRIEARVFWMIGRQRYEAGKAGQRHKCAAQPGHQWRLPDSAHVAVKGGPKGHGQAGHGYLDQVS
ncbi:hypothetical protein MMA231_00207 [Asticcacaulis sp. MM231]